MITKTLIIKYILLSSLYDLKLLIINRKKKVSINYK